MIEREYSKALYDLAENVNDIKEEFNTFIILNDDELSSVLNSPKIKKEDKKALLRSVLKGFNEVFIDFLCVLIDNNRFNIIKNINKDFNDLILEENGIVKVMVSTSKKLSDAELNELSDYLCKKLNKKIIFYANLNF